jgi:hypothetical protein
MVSFIETDLNFIIFPISQIFNQVSEDSSDRVDFDAKFQNWVVTGRSGFGSERDIFGTGSVLHGIHNVWDTIVLELWVIFCGHVSDVEFLQLFWWLIIYRNSKLCCCVVAVAAATEKCDMSPI